MQTDQQLHQTAIDCAKKYQRAEAALLDSIQKIDGRKVFLKLGYSSLFAYVVEALHLSESQAYNFINVSRKAKEVPELKQAVEQGTLSVSKARRIVPVLKIENSKEWIQKAITLPQRKIEREVAKQSPQLRVKERIRPIADARSELKCGISTSLERKLKRIQDLLSQKRQKHCGLEESLETIATFYLERNDPIEKAKRSTKKKQARPKGLALRQVARRAKLPASTVHQLNLRDRGQCTFVGPNKQRCTSQRWLDIHHKIPLSQGGDNSLENLATLCSSHHKHVHGSSGWRRKT